jgi:xanthine dehydrogenase accessory factor
MSGSLDGWDVLEHAQELSRRGEAFALATVVWRAGPSSGQHGSRAVITASGELYGWIGGACAEPVVIREAQKVIASGEPKLLALGQAGQFESLPEGMVSIAISCSSEGALQIYVEPVLPAPQLVVVGRSPMAHTLVDLATALGWRATLHDGASLSAADVSQRSFVVVATQGHHDEEAVEAAVAAFPAFVGLVASRKRGEAVLGALADKGVPRNLLDRVRVPVGLDLGHTTHREIAVAILAELVKVRASGAVSVPRPLPLLTAKQAVDPVCGMTVTADASGRPFEHEGVTYYFCCPGCRRAFERDPAAYLSPQEA